LFLVGFASEGRKKAAYGHVFYQKQLASIMSRSAKGPAATLMGPVM
jgi:hypothetical protein